MIERICLVFPRFKYKSGDPPLGLCYIAAYLRSKLAVEVSILDTTFHPSFNYVSRYLQAKRPELVGIYFNTSMHADGKRIARMAKEMGSIVVAGGPHATISPESLINDVDIVAIGEGEDTMYKLTSLLPRGDLSEVKGIWFKDNNCIRKNPPGESLPNLDSLEIPALDLVDMDKYFNYWHYLDCITPKSRGINIIASRGCIFNCSFCQPTIKKMFGDRVRYKSPEYLAKEITYYIERYKVKKFFFHDDTFALDRNWAYRFFDVLEKKNIDIQWGCNSRIDIWDDKIMRRMREVGARCIHFGIESGSQRVLDQIYKKGIKLDQMDKVIKIAKRIGIYTGGFFMLGAPTETKREVAKTIKLALMSGLNEASFSIATPLPGTRLYDMMKNDGRYIIDNNYTSFDYYKKISYSGGEFSSKMLTFLQRKALLLFYLHPLRWGYILKYFLYAKSLSKLYHKIKRFF